MSMIYAQVIEDMRGAVAELQARSPANGNGPNAANEAGHVADLAGVAEALSEPLRLRLLFELAAGERNVTGLHAAFGVPQPTISKHLYKLLESDLVRWRRDGRWIFYTLGENARPAGNGVEVKAGPFVVRIDKCPGAAAASSHRPPAHLASAVRRT